MKSEMQITAIAEMMPNGQMITAAAIRYDKVIQNESLSCDQFQIEDRTIVRVYANDCPRRAEDGKNGNYVILELSLKDKKAPVIFDPEKNRRDRRHPSIDMNHL